MSGNNKNELIRAAGGLVWRETEEGREIVIIHRSRYGDWTLPKGKLDEGERWEAAALREVGEETGFRTQLTSFAGITFYYHKERPKVVLFWNMAFKELDLSSKEESDSPDEGDQVLWLTVPEALKRMSYDGEKALVQQEADLLVA